MTKKNSNIEKYGESVSELIELAAVCRAAKHSEDPEDARMLMSQAERMAYRLWDEFSELETELEIVPYAPQREVPSRLSRIPS
ncbi:MAG: hypothetical protein V7720_04015 [Halioglobus sp.]